MAKEITVTIRADITLEITKEMEKIIKLMRRAEENDDWGLYCKLAYRLEKLISDKISEEIVGIEDIDVLDTNY